jgi:hypothetical protein
MNAEPLSSGAEIELVTPATEPRTAPNVWTILAKLWHWFLCLVVILLGLFFGSIAAQVIGFFTGWTPFLC